MTVVDNLYLQNLEEYVLDEGRIVTYKWLSKTLEVHVNQAKQMLYAFVQQERNKKDNDQFNVTYFVSGFTEDNGVKSMQNQIVPEERLEAARSRLHPITSCHIYSVHKTKVKDTNALYISDLDIVRDQLLRSNKFSAITCTSAQCRSKDEMNRLKAVAQPTTNAPSFTKPSNQSSSADKTTQKKPSPGIAGMFAASGKKKESESKPTKPSPEKSNGEQKAVNDYSSKASKTKASGIGHFFSNQASKPKKTSVDSQVNGKQEATTDSAEKSHNSPQNRISPKKERSPTPKKESQKNRRKKRTDSDDDSEQQKKRRRIKAAVWSDSSEEEEQEMETEPSPPTPPPSPPREPSPTPEKQESPVKDLSSEQNSSSRFSGSSGKRRKRQKKLVSKTFMDESGFMVTEKVFESCSESASDEEPIPPTPPVRPNRQPAAKNTNQEKKSPHSKKSPASAGVGKQSTLMSFFKKK